MGVYSGPKVSKNNLSLALDAANTKNYNLTAIEYLIVGGGGSGGIGEANPAGDGAGGGGAGGVLTNVGGTPLSISSGQSYTIVVGNGGVNASGGNSSAFGLTAFGGGRGGNVRNASVTSGGSGGGAGGNCGQSNRTGGAGTASQGNRGGNDLAPTAGCSLRGGRGGGGAGSAATDAASAQGTSGGNGIVSYISGTMTYYAGGGGGGRGSSNGVGGAGGLGGGGNGSNGTAVATAGSANTGAGGGGGASSGSGTSQLTGGNGGSGIVIVRYPGPQKAIGGTVTFNKGYTIHTFTAVGSTTFTPLVATNNSAVLGLSDFSGNNRFATSVNGPTYSSANGGFLSFDGTDDYVSSGALSGSFASFTVIIWFYPTSVTNYENPIDCNYSYNGSTGNIGPRLEMNSSGTLAWMYSNDTANNNNFYSHPVVSSGLAANTWHFAAITYSGGTSTTYYNGNVTGLSRSTIGSPSGFVGVMNNVTIGKGFHLGGAERIFTGRVSNTKIYNRALTAAEIRQNFNANRGRFGI